MCGTTLTAPALLLSPEKNNNDNNTKPATMDNIYDTIDEGNVTEERRERADSPAEAREQLYSEVQVHASAEEERASPDYMEIKEDRHSCSSPSSSDEDDEEEVRKVAEHQVEVEVEVVVEPEPAAEVEVEQVNGEAHDGSRRSSASSASSASHGDPCDDPPIQPKTLEEDGMLMAYTHPDTDPRPEESVDYTLTTLENLSVDDSSAAPADPDQPEISLFTKVRLRGWDGPCCFNLSKSEQNTEKSSSKNVCVFSSAEEL